MPKLAAGLAANIGDTVFGMRRGNRGRSLRTVVLMRMGPRFVSGTLGENKSLLFLFDGSRLGIFVVRGPSWGILAPIEECEALVRGFGI
jgi:hypothetical protein